jgi:peptidase E
LSALIRTTSQWSSIVSLPAFSPSLAALRNFLRKYDVVFVGVV